MLNMTMITTTATAATDSRVLACRIADLSGRISLLQEAHFARGDAVTPLEVASLMTAVATLDLARAALRAGPPEVCAALLDHAGAPLWLCERR
jgi:hypothetical protein